MTPQRRLAERRRESNLCVKCGDNEPAHLKVQCQACVDKTVETNRRNREARISRGECSECNNKAIEKQTDLKGRPAKKPLCVPCWVKSRTYCHTGSSKGWEIMLARFVENPRCRYTGEELRLGDNATLDHKYPKSRLPELASSLDNLEWVSDTANRSKQDMTPEEFIAFCRTILENAE